MVLIVSSRLQEIFSKYPLCKDIDTIYIYEVRKIPDQKLQKHVDENTDSVIEVLNRKINTMNFTLNMSYCSWFNIFLGNVKLVSLLQSTLVSLLKLEGGSHKDTERKLYAFELEIQKRFRRYVGDVNKKGGWVEERWK